MTWRRNLKIWRFLNESNEQKSPPIWMIFDWIFILQRSSNLRKLVGKSYNLEDILLFP